MFNLLPFEEKKKIRAEYKKRVGVVALLFVLVAEVTALALLVPTILLALANEREAVTQLEEYTAKTIEGEGGSFATMLKEATEKLSELSSSRNTARPSEAVVLLAQAKVEGVHILRISYKAGKDFKTGDLQIEGRSDNREALLLFRQNLEQEPRFSVVKLPVSNFAQEQDIPFSITLSVSFLNILHTL